MTPRLGAWTVSSAVALLTCIPALAQNTSPDRDRLGRELLRDLIQTNTSRNESLECEVHGDGHDHRHRYSIQQGGREAPARHSPQRRDVEG
jgi:hypothetical protein